MENYKNPDFVAETDGTFFRKMAIFEKFTISNGKNTVSHAVTRRENEPHES